MSTSPHVGFNPLPWFFIGDGFNRAAAPPIEEIYREIRDAGFGAVPAEVPQGMSVDAYRQLLARVRLEPAPGYFQAPFSDSAATPSAIEAAKRVASQHAQLGLDRIFIADQFGASPRVATPAQGVESDAGRLQTIADNLARIATALTAEGVVPCLHQHVGTWIESPEETTTLLDTVGADVLLFGPDTGHLAWAGADPAEIIGRYRQRVGAVHLKDLRRHVAQGRDYRQAGAAHLWTEPGRGDVEFASVLRELAGFAGWYVVEVDVSDQPTPKECAAVSARWVREHIGGGAPTIA
ncbi:MAG: sugar phosphate isomerase/epimerase [Chloroflexota bacterium]|nr:sugar phosphate isomerase/epimerase [Chloroflexota bacterium]